MQIEESGRESAGRGAEILLRYRNELFMILRDDKPEINAPLQWVVPAGVIEVGETDDEAMTRELKEELDIAVAYKCLGQYRGYTWYVGELNDALVGSIRQGEGCGRGLFSFEALVALSRVGGKGGIGGTILQIMQNNSLAIHDFLLYGAHPNLRRLMTG